MKKFDFAIKGIFGFAIPLLLLIVGTAEGIIIDRIVAKVNDEIITLSEVQEKGMPLLSRVRGGDNGEVQEAEKGVLDRLIDMKLQLQDAKGLGLTVSDEEADEVLKDIREKNGLTQEALVKVLEESGAGMESYRNEIKNQIILQRIYRFRVIASAKVNPKDIEAYYQSHISEYKRQEKVKVRQIFFEVDPHNPAKREDLVQVRALEVLERLKAGEDFVELTKAYSEGPKAATGGDLGYFKRGEALPVLEETMFKLAPGTVSDLIRSKAGFHILKAEEHIYPAPSPLEEVKKEISEAIKKEKAQENYEEWMRKLREKAFIEVTYDLQKKKP